MAQGSKAAAKAVNKMKAAANVLSGYPGIFKHLAGEHAEVSTLMQRVVSSPGDSNTPHELFPEIRKNLLAHAKAEEQEFYAALKRFPDLDALVERCLDEHHQVEEKLAELEAGDKSSAAWRTQFERLVHAVEVHVEREENELFPKARDLLSSDEAKEMEQRYEQAENREKERL